MEEEDLQGWEVVPDDGFLEIHDEDDGKKIFSRKFGIGPSNVFKNYFICPSPKSSSPKFVDSTLPPKQLVTVVPFHLDPPNDDDDLEFLKKLANPHPIPLNIPTEKIVEAPTTGGGGDQDPVSQVSFKKKKEPEFVEMKLDSPRSNNNNNSSNWGIKSSQGTIQFDDGEEKSISKDTMEVKKDVSWEENENSGSGGPSIWKWSLTGIGAICSFGVAAATVCIVILGGHLKNNNNHNQDNKLQFHIYADDKVYNSRNPFS